MKKRGVSAAAGGWLPALALIGIMGLSGICVAQPSESEVLVALADKGVAPSLKQAATASRGLAEAVRQLCAQKDAAHLELARAAWQEAFLAWRRAEPFQFGIGKGGKQDRSIDEWPVNAIVLDQVAATKDFAHLRESKDIRGFSGAEYLLFVPADATAATAAERCPHLQDIADEIAGRNARLYRQWQEEDSRRFVAAGDGEPFLMPEDAFAPVFARMLNVTERLLRDRITIPSGSDEIAAKPEALEAWRSALTRDAIRATIAGLRLALVGDGRTGITGLVAVRDGLVSQKNPQLAEAIAHQLDRIDKRLDDLGGGRTLYEALTSKTAVLKPLYDDIETLQKQIVEASLTLEVDVRMPGEL